jgi:hypothetical protein
MHRSEKSKANALTTKDTKVHEGRHKEVRCSGGTLHRSEKSKANALTTKDTKVHEGIQKRCGVLGGRYIGVKSQKQMH